MGKISLDISDLTKNRYYIINTLPEEILSFLLHLFNISVEVHQASTVAVRAIFWPNQQNPVETVVVTKEPEQMCSLVRTVNRSDIQGRFKPSLVLKTSGRNYEWQENRHHSAENDCSQDHMEETHLVWAAAGSTLATHQSCKKKKIEKK